MIVNPGIRRNLGGISTWRPTKAPATLKAFYLPGIGQTNASGNCSAWADQSGNGNALAEGSAGKGLTINADGSLTSNGIDQWMTKAFTLAQPSVVTILARQDIWTLNRYLFDGGVLNGGVLIQTTATPQIQAYAGSFGPATSSLAVGAYGVVQIVFSGAASTIRINNGSAITADAGVGSMGGFTIGANAGGAAFSNITVKGVSIRNATDATINANDRLFWMRMGGLS